MFGRRNRNVHHVVLTHRKPTSIVTWAVLVLIVFFSVPCVWISYEESVNPTPEQDSRYTDMHKRLSYLKTLPEVQWVEFEGNRCYFSVDPATITPDDFESMIRSAAAHGNRALGFGVHVWAVVNKPKGWRPGNSSDYILCTFRYGKCERFENGLY